MGMQIDDSVDFLNEAKDFFVDVANDPKIKESIKIYLTIESLEIAISTMHKYQKIEQIISDGYLQGKSSGEMLLNIKGVMNGNDTKKECEQQIYGKESWNFVGKCQDMIQSKIDKLKENTDDTNTD